VIKRLVIGMACLALIPAPASASAAAAAIAAGAAASAAAGASTSSGSSPEQLPQGVSSTPIEWERVGWLYCPSRFAEPSGCRETIDRGWRNDEAGDVEPWVEWMKRHQGANARYMGMTKGSRGSVSLFYGVPAENGEGGGE
jgi:hypothetical protein